MCPVVAPGIARGPGQSDRVALLRHREAAAGGLARSANNNNNNNNNNTNDNDNDNNMFFSPPPGSARSESPLVGFMCCYCCCCCVLYQMFFCFARRPLFGPSGVASLRFQSAPRTHRKHPDCSRRRPSSKHLGM